MPKIITLEKGNDGVYTASGEVIEIPEIKIESNKETIVINKTSIKKINKKLKRQENVSRFIVNNGDKAESFLNGMTEVIKIANIIRKVIK